MDEPRQPLRHTVVQGRTEPVRGANLVRVGVQNRALVLDLVRRFGPLARAELSRVTGLSAQTVSNIAAGMVSAGLARETPTGRLLEIVPGSRSAVGVHLDPAHLVVVRVDLTGAVQAVEHVDLDSVDDPAQTLDTMAAMVRAVTGTGAGSARGAATARTARGAPTASAAAAARTARAAAAARTARGAATARAASTAPPAGIGLAVPGSIDPDGVRMGDPAQLPAWHALPVADELARRTGLPVRLEKDGVASALGEVWASPAPDDLVSVFLGHGISAATVASGEVVRGATGNAGEFGGMPVQAHGRWMPVWEACQPFQQVRRAVDEGLLPAELPLDRAVDVRRAFDALCALPASGPLVAAAGSALGEALAHVVELLDVRRVTVGGSAARSGSAVFLDAVRARLAERLPRGPFATVAPSAFGEEGVARGAACSVLRADLASQPAPDVGHEIRPGGTVRLRSIAHPW